VGAVISPIAPDELLLTRAELPGARRDLDALKRVFTEQRHHVPDPGRPYCDHCGSTDRKGLTLGVDEQAELIAIIDHEHEQDDPEPAKLSAPFGGYSTSLFAPSEGELEAENPTAWMKWKLAKDKRANERTCIDGKACSARRAQFPARAPVARIPDYVAAIENRISYASHIAATCQSIVDNLALQLSHQIDSLPSPEPAAAPRPVFGVDHPLFTDRLYGLRPYGSSAAVPDTECPDPRAHEAPRRRRRGRLVHLERPHGSWLSLPLRDGDTSRPLPWGHRPGLRGVSGDTNLALSRRPV
jgi:hypothetical protein